MPLSNAHALLIGVGTFQFTPRHNVPITVQDAEAVAEVLKNPDFCGYPDHQVTLLTKESATKANIINELRNLANNTDEESLVVLFFCSHGGEGLDENWYFMPHDAQLKKKGKLAKIVPETGFGHREFVNLIREIPASKLFIFFNTCQSGYMSQKLDISAGEDLDIPTNEGFVQSKNPDFEMRSALLMEGKGTVIMTAAGEQQFSSFNAGADLTYFTEALVDGLHGVQGVPDQQGYISIFDLYQYVYKILKKNVFNQEPELNILKGIGALPISLYKGNPANLSLNDFDGQTDLPQDVNVQSVPLAKANQAAQNILGEGAFQIQNSQNVNVDQSHHETNSTSTGRDVTHGGKFNIGSIQGTNVAVGSNATINQTHYVAEKDDTLGKEETKEQIIQKLSQELEQFRAAYMDEVTKVEKRLRSLIESAESDERDEEVIESNGQLFVNAVSQLSDRAGFKLSIAQLANKVVNLI